jgi:hypothetical protein
MAGKRGQNEGSIVKRADGRWCAVLNLGYADGKRKRKYYYTVIASRRSSATAREWQLLGQPDSCGGTDERPPDCSGLRRA